MLSKLKNEITACIHSSLQESFSNKVDSFDVGELEIPANKSHGEFSSNIALKSAKIFKQPPMKIAEQFVGFINKAVMSSPLKEQILRVEVKSPGFINFFLTTQTIQGVLRDVLEQRDRFGRMPIGQGQRVQIEFVSANPTGPLSVAHARQAAVGDALANVLRFLDFNVDKEYYVNDEGNQINILGRSIKSRAKEILGCVEEFPEEGYQGDYIKDMAGLFIGQRNIQAAEEVDAIELQEFSRFGVEYLMDVIRTDLRDFGVHFDVWSHQSQIATGSSIQDVLGYLQGKKFLYEKDGALWFRTTDLGDDKDRVLRKSDSSYTYLTPDIAYHRNKYERGYQRIFNIWGPDHHGYIPRIKASVQALGYDPGSLEVLIVQLATIYRNGKPVSMSTRRGQYISLREVIDEVGVDAARFFFLMRGISAHLDFDLELAKKETPENPVYYIQYAYARIHSIIKKAHTENIDPDIGCIQYLEQDEEIDLIKKIGFFPDALVICEKQRDVFALVNYLMELANCFHRFYDCHRVVDQSAKSISSGRLTLIDATRIVLANGLRLLGIRAPERM